MIIAIDIDGTICPTMKWVLELFYRDGYSTEEALTHYDFRDNHPMLKENFHRYLDEIDYTEVYPGVREVIAGLKLSGNAVVFHTAITSPIQAWKKMKFVKEFFGLPLMIFNSLGQKKFHGYDVLIEDAPSVLKKNHNYVPHILMIDQTWNENEVPAEKYPRVIRTDWTSSHNVMYHLARWRCF